MYCNVCKGGGGGGSSVGVGACIDDEVNTVEECASLTIE